VKQKNIELLWDWLSALRRRDTPAMAAGLHTDVVWQGIREDLVCHGPEEVIETYVSGYDALKEIDSLELLASERHAVLVARGQDLGEIGGIELGTEICNVFTIDNEKIVRIEDYLRRAEALAAAEL
jgi:ketosteroid isomerase-like protein